MDLRKKVGDLIDEDKIEKRYFIEDEGKSKFNEIFENTPIEYFRAVEEIIVIVSK